MILGIDPKVDYAFKYLVGRDSTRAILIDVLNRVLEPTAGHEIREVELLNPLTLGEKLDDKLSILDIKARDQSGRQFNIEMQMLASPHYDKRILYYWSNLYGEPIHQGDPYSVLRPTISISFLNHVLFPQVPDHHLRFQLLETRHHFPMTGDVEFHILELPKFTKSLAELRSGLDVWLYFLRFAEKIDTEALPAALQDPGIVRAVETLEMLTQTEIERERYKSREKALHDHNTLMAYAHEQGQEIGKQIGQKIGAIHTFEYMLDRAETSEEQLRTMSLDDLTRLADALKKQASQRK